MKGGLKLVICLTLIASLFGGEAFVFAGDVHFDIEELNAEIESRKSNIDQLNRQIDLYQAKISEAQAKEVTLRNELDLLTNRIAKTELDIASTEAEIDLANAELAVLDTQIHQLEIDLETQRSLIKDVLYEIQIQDADLALHLVFGSDSFSELFDDLQRLETVSSELEGAVESSKEVRLSMMDQFDQQEVKKERLEELQDAFMKQQRLLEEEVGAHAGLIVATQESEVEFQRLLADSHNEQNAIEQQIAFLQSEIEGRLREQDEDDGSPGVLSWPFDPPWGLSATFHDPTYPFRHLFEHSGIDLPASVGMPIGSAGPGYVAWTRQGRMYGNYVMIIHSGGLATLYAHMHTIDVVADQYVGRGERIGTVGNTGFSTGPHLHFEVRKNGIPTNPMNYLR